MSQGKRMNVGMHEIKRLEEASGRKVPWRKWGPYLSERQWGTVREDYSKNGDPWTYFTHDQARSRAYRSGEDGIAGLCDDRMRLCFAVAFWNEKDPILKERFFGLTNGEGNHGEDVKEYYFYLDNTPTHSYMKMLYKYPQRAFPYADLVETNRSRGRNTFEYELLDTNIFDEDRYFDVFVEYAKAAPEDILIRITAINRGPERAPLHVLPHLWFRNTWWNKPRVRVPSLSQQNGGTGNEAVIVARHEELGERHLYCETPRELLFTNNETNLTRIFSLPNKVTFVKDGINNYLVHNRPEEINPERKGTKAAAHYYCLIEPGAATTFCLRLSDRSPSDIGQPLGSAFDRTFTTREREADDFYASLTPNSITADGARVIRQGFAGMLWSKQVYVYEVNEWLKEHGRPGSDGPVPIRNSQWFHMESGDIISAPDKWEYPWFAAWDLAFHSVALSLLDPDFAADQLDLALRERYLHPNGQMPAYEWNFDHVNPPVHAWATLFNYRQATTDSRARAVELLKSEFNKLLLNFTWWVNRRDRDGRNIFEGGFLGLDNIGLFDRSAPLPAGGSLEQGDGTPWMALYAQNMLEMAIELALHDRVYESLASKFYEHFVWIASTMSRVDDFRSGMWDEDDGFYYDVLKLPDGRATRTKVRSMVGLLPLCAVTVYPSDIVLRLPQFSEAVARFNHHHPDLLAGIDPAGKPGVNGRHMLAVLTERRLRRVLARLLDQNEFLGDYGIRSLSRYHLEHPCVLHVGGEEYRLRYLPAESDDGVFGGNSNWRGPIWMPLNALLIRALLQMHSYYGDEFKVEFPTGSGNHVTLFEVARNLADRLGRIFLKDPEGRRPVYGGTEKFQNDRHWRDLILFHEYFHGDNGAGLGASHQTGWTGLIAGFLCLFAKLKSEDVLEHGVGGLVTALQQARANARRSRSARKPEAVTVREPAISGRSFKRASFLASGHLKPRSRRLREDGEG